MNKILTAKEIKWIDTIGADKKAIDENLAVSINYFNNVKSDVLLREKDFWYALMGKYRLDSDKDWTLKSIEGTVCIVEIIKNDT